MYSDRLKALRERQGYTQTELGNIIEVGKSQYSHYENERVTIPIKHLNTLCNYFQASIDYIFGFTDTQNYKKLQANIDKNKSSIRLKEFRKENNLTQKKLASFLNTTFSTISSYECGINIINTSYLYAICKKYKISADYLLGKNDNPKYL